MDGLPKKVEMPFDILAAAIAFANADDFKSAWELMRLAQDTAFALEDETTFNAMYGATALELTWLRQIAKCKEMGSRKGATTRKRTATRGRLRVAFSFAGGNPLRS